MIREEAKIHIMAKFDFLFDFPFLEFQVDISNTDILYQNYDLNLFACTIFVYISAAVITNY